MFFSNLQLDEYAWTTCIFIAIEGPESTVSGSSEEMRLSQKRPPALIMLLFKNTEIKFPIEIVIVEFYI